MFLKTQKFEKLLCKHSIKSISVKELRDRNKQGIFLLKDFERIVEIQHKA